MQMALPRQRFTETLTSIVYMLLIVFVTTIYLVIVSITIILLSSNCCLPTVTVVASSILKKRKNWFNFFPWRDLKSSSPNAIWTGHHNRLNGLVKWPKAPIDLFGPLYIPTMTVKFFVDGTHLTNQAGIDAILADISMLLPILPSNGDKLYTPKNIGVNCKKMAIKCFMKEVDVLKEENQDNENITNIIYHIQRNIHDIWREDLQNINQENMCPQCEMYEAQHSKVFLKYLIEFLQFAHQTGF